MVARLFLSSNEVNNLLRDAGPPLRSEWVTGRVMASFMAAWSITNMPFEAYPRLERDPATGAQGVVLGGIHTPLLSDAAIWELLGLPPPVSPQFARAIDLDFPCMYARTASLAAAVMELRDITGKCVRSHRRSTCNPRPPRSAWAASPSLASACSRTSSRRC